jgi:hypothetical protein
VIADQCASGGDPITFYVLHTFDEHGSVECEVDSVEWKMSLETIQEFFFEQFVRGAFDGATGNGAGVEGGQKIMGVAVQKLQGGALAQGVSAQDAEVFQAGSDAAVGAALGMDAAKGNALANHPYWNTISHLLNS